MPAPRIRTDFIYPPIPIRDFDWQAMREDDEPPCHVGFGRTEQEAIADLMMLIEGDETT